MTPPRPEDWDYRILQIRDAPSLEAATAVGCEIFTKDGFEVLQYVGLDTAVHPPAFRFLARRRKKQIVIADRLPSGPEHVA